MQRVADCKTYRNRFGIISVFDVFQVEYGSCTSCFVFVHALTGSMTSGLANFGETCEIQVHWYFTWAVCRFMNSNEVVVSHETEPLCYDWIAEAKNLKMSIFSSDPCKTNAFTENEQNAAAKATCLAELGGLEWRLFPKSMYEIVQKVLMSH